MGRKGGFGEICLKNWWKYTKNRTYNLSKIRFEKYLKRRYNMDRIFTIGLLWVPLM